MAPDLPASVWPLVQAATGRPWPPADAASAEAFVARAQGEGLLPLLFESPPPSPAVASALEARGALRRLAEMQAQILGRAIRTVCDVLEGEPIILLKGADYGGRLYGRLALRPMQDLDVLVPRARFEAACRRIRDTGGAPRPARSASARAASFYYERAFVLDGAIVEVHHSFVQRARHRVDYEGVWRRRQGVPGLAASRLSDTDALVAHALAMGKDELSVPLIRYVDLWLMLRAGVDVSEAAARARAWRAARAFYGMLRHAQRLVPELGTPDLERVTRSLLAPPVRALLDAWVLPDPKEQGREGVVTRTRQLWRKFWLMDNTWRRASFAVQHACATIVGRMAAPER